MLYAVTSSYHPTSSPEVLRLVFTKLPLHRTCGPYASTNQQKRTPAHVHLQDAAACLCTGMRPFVESVSASRTRRELLRVRAKKDYHLEGLQAQTLAPDLAGQQIRGFVLRCDVSIIIYPLNPQLHSRSATYIKRNGLLIRKITIKSSRPFQCAYHPLTP